MAKQKGPIKIKGTLGDITFAKTKDGYLVKEKTSLDGKRIKNDPNFQRTRENYSEFGRAAKAVRLLRTSIRTLLLSCKDSRVSSRLVKEMMKVIKADATSSRGLRNVVDGEAELLQGFEFNANATLSSTFFAQYVPSIDRATGVLEISIPSFIPIDEIVMPAGATHFKIVSAGTSVDFENNKFEEANSNTGILPCDATPVAPVTLTNTITGASTHPLFLVLGIQFYQLVNGNNYPLKNGAYNALSLVKISGI